MKSTRRGALIGGMSALAFTPLSREPAAQTRKIDAIHGLPADMYQAVTQGFNAATSDTSVKLEAPAQTYEELTQRVLRGAVGGGVPDVAFQGINRVSWIVEKGWGTPLQKLVSSPDEWSAMGYLPAMLDLGRVGSATYGLPFAVSTPMIFYNASLVKAAGGDPDKFPSDWDGIISLARRIKALGDNNIGLHYAYFDLSGNFSFIALVQSLGGRMATADNKNVAFDGAEGFEALELMYRFGEVMVDMSHSQAMQAFTAGKLGMLVTSSAATSQVERDAGGKFMPRGAMFPRRSESARLPAGGAVAMILARDPERIAAAWNYVKYATGPIGQTIMVKQAGYAPGNSLAVAQLESFYTEHPLHRVSIGQLPYMGSWYAFPGENSIKITTVIRDHLQRVVTRKAQPREVLADMAKDVRGLMPRS